MAHFKGIALSKYYGKIFPAYHKVLEKGDGLFYAAPNILERKFRDGIEMFIERDENGEEVAYLANSTVSALLDALEQVRDVVGRFCGTMEHIANYSCTSPLYKRFGETGIVYPPEILHMWDTAFWKSYFTPHDLSVAITKVQIWAMWMTMALHCLGMYEGSKNPYLLPPIPCGHLHLAEKVWKEDQEEAKRGRFMRKLWNNIQLHRINLKTPKVTPEEVEDDLCSTVSIFPAADPFQYLTNLQPSLEPDDESEWEDAHMEEEEAPGLGLYLGQQDEESSGSSSASGVKMVRFGTVETA